MLLKLHLEGEFIEINVYLRRREAKAKEIIVCYLSSIA
jgi:hypothetical protein